MLSGLGIIFIISTIIINFGLIGEKTLIEKRLKPSYIN